jgi:predicted lactoylglutathione lyase
MTKQLWINLPVKDVHKAQQFFAAIGFSAHIQTINNEDIASLLIGEQQVRVMLFPEATFQRFTNHELAKTSLGSEVLFSIDAESKEEVDELLVKVERAGGTVYGKHDQGWMYGAGFIDLDGHRWNVLYMDMSKQ